MKYKLTIDCSAYYDGELEIPDDLTEEEAYEFALNHLNRIPVGPLIRMSDSDTIDKELFRYQFLKQRNFKRYFVNEIENNLRIYEKGEKRYPLKATIVAEDEKEAHKLFNNYFRDYFYPDTFSYQWKGEIPKDHKEYINKPKGVYETYDM